MFPRWTNIQKSTVTLQSAHQTAATSAIAHIVTQSPTRPSPPTGTETILLRTWSGAQTRSLNKTMTQGTLCVHCRPSPDLLYARSFQVAEFAEEYIALHQIDPDPPLHYGYYMEETQLNQRLRRVQCRCVCQTCDIQGTHLRIMHDFTATARRIAQEDVDAFRSGTRPTPVRLH